MQRSKFTIEGRFLTHECVNPFTGKREERVYRCPIDGGYLTVSVNGGDQRQPHTRGATWSAKDVPSMVALVKREWRQECREARAEGQF